MDAAQKEQMVKRLRVSRLAESEEILNYWRDQGRLWASEEASYEELSRLAEIAGKASRLKTADATNLVVEEFQAIWRNGFEKGAAPFGWDDMGDQLPGSSLLAFAQGVESAWKEVHDKI